MFHVHRCFVSCRTKDEVLLFHFFLECWGDSKRSDGRNANASSQNCGVVTHVPDSSSFTTVPEEVDAAPMQSPHTHRELQNEMGPVSSGA